jgi:hypothetical protein
MSITYKYNLKFIGIGDLTFFCGEMLLRLTKEDILEIKINKDSLTKYRNGSESYEKFCIDYVKYILSEYTVLECQTEPDRTWEINYDYIDQMLGEPRIKKIFQKKFLSGKINDDHKGHLILFTKVRAYQQSNFNNFSNIFFNHLNSLDTKIILIGERTVHYTGENEILGKDIVYSLYDEYLKNISNDKIIDLTNDDYSPNSISLESIINDLTLISNSKKMIMIGCGGFFCTSLFTEKLLSINDNLIFSQFSVESNKQVFKDVNQFLEVLQNV